MKVALAFRLILICYGHIHDYLFDVDFTDVDYHVVSDAGRLIADGRSPFDRVTYRYTPLLAWMMIPNVFFYDFGKIIFSLFDLIVGWLGYQMASDVATCQDKSYSRRCTIALALWLFFPVTAIVSTRGNADVVVCTAVIVSLYLLEKKKIIASALVYGCFAVQFKIYPIIYLPSIFLSLANLPHAPSRCSWGEYAAALMRNWKGYLYAIAAFLSCGFLTLVFYHMYGQSYLDESLLYHFKRVDIRHNFSPYHLLFYLSYGGDPLTLRIAGTLAFLPQLFIVVALGFRFHHDLPFCWFVSTIAFVAFNKVCTSQYFIWYLCFIPIVHRSLKITFAAAMNILVIWLIPQGLWLCAAYALEFQGYGVFIALLVFSFLMLSSYVYTLRRLIAYYAWEETCKYSKQD
uniref:GPI alpha-1,4-mannosyltransferase I, catalytic subunit n=1 Tax=Steinernema glaseri TaxID=37863 RepID=A0A1I8AVR7_9BILA